MTRWILWISFVPNLALAANQDWVDLEGCYRTIRYNQVTTPTIVDNHGDGMGGEQKLFALPDGTMPPKFEFLLFEYEQGTQPISGDEYIFPDIGTTVFSPDRKMRTWSYNGPVYFQLANPPLRLTLQASVTLKDLGADQYELDSHRVIPEIPDHSFDADDQFVLQRYWDQCWLCTTDPSGKLNCHQPIKP